MGIKVCALQRHLEVDPSTLLYAYYFLQTKLMMCERVVSNHQMLISGNLSSQSWCGVLVCNQVQ
jgi:hypothetical protein